MTHFTKMIAVLLVLVLIAQGIATMTAAGKDKPPKQRDVVEFVVGAILILAAAFIGLKTFDAL
jgi:uncharacterized membrane protein